MNRRRWPEGWTCLVDPPLTTGQWKRFWIALGLRIRHKHRSRVTANHRELVEDQGGERAQ